MILTACTCGVPLLVVRAAPDIAVVCSKCGGNASTPRRTRPIEPDDDGPELALPITAPTVAIPTRTTMTDAGEVDDFEHDRRCSEFDDSFEPDDETGVVIETPAEE